MLIIAGSKGMVGAAILCARAALRTGAGLVTVSIEDELFPILQVAQPEAMCIPRKLSNFSEVDINRFDSIAIGPGIGEAVENEQVLNYIFKHYSGKLIIDADALNTIAREKIDENLRKANAEVVITPHMGEARRLLCLDEENTMSRNEIAEKLSVFANGVALLKGQNTLVASQTEGTYTNIVGNPGMATGGSGDALTGVIASLAAQGLSIWDSAKAGSFIHGLAGDIAAEKLSEHAMIAGDIIECIPLVYKKILK